MLGNALGDFKLKKSTPSSKIISCILVGSTTWTTRSNQHGAISPIKVAKESESRILNKLEEIDHEKAERKDALETALHISESREKKS